MTQVSGRPESPIRRIAISGASGLVGQALSERLENEGWQVAKLVRGKNVSPNDIRWNPATGEIDRAALEGLQALVHLAGESLAEGRWTPDKKAAILESRRMGTRLLAECLAGLSSPPPVMISASAIGYYGHRPDERISEASESGTGFLSEVCRVWEAATEAARAAGLRVVNLRIGVVLSSNGGALKRMLPPFKLGVGGRLGAGRQGMSWITLDDLVSAIGFCIENEELDGPVNAVAPEPVSNAVFTKALGRALHRPAVFPIPAPMVRLLFGEMGQSLLLEGAKVYPERLLGAGFRYRYPSLGVALKAVLNP